MLLSPSADLAARWSRLRGERPALRIRDAAATLGVSEAELVALGIGQTTTALAAARAAAAPPGVSEAELVALGIGQTTTALAADWRALLADMPSVGRVMC